MGLVVIVKSAPSDHRFLRATDDGDPLGPLRYQEPTAKFERKVVLDKGVAPNHGWRHRFKPVGTRAGIERRVLFAASDFSTRIWRKEIIAYPLVTRLRV